ncbi:XrtA/PEP-CTERM system histidine kinase PrsK [Sphingomonas sp. OTU376]|uniref:XrtA/PEP-CTERM system histidine kinase PrsK n=1 Tax=Sphingomonas sp. OTU376 TaxID=3043863 RepID=UPI00313DF5FE
MAALLLWLHALAALLFGALALWAWRADLAGLPRRPLAIALAATALWALAVAGIGTADVASWFAETLRNLAWLGFMLVLHRRDAQSRPPIALGTVYGVVALVQVAALILTLIVYTNPEPELAVPVANAALLMRMLVAVAALVLVQALWSALSPGAGGALRTLVVALAAIWCTEFALYTVAYVAAEWRIEPLVLRGLAYLAVALAIGTALQRKGEWKIEVSRAVTYQSLSLVAIGAYFALLALATSAIATIGGANARVLQTAFVLGSTAAILTLVANSWLRAWLKVKLAKHLFRHRYDYRTEWMRFTETLGNPQGGAALDERIVKAIADLTESPAGVLLVPDAGGLGVGASWNWDRATLPIAGDTALAEHLRLTGRIVELDAIRRNEDHLDAAAVPQWMLDVPEAWAIVPLPHLTELAGAILLARPTLDRALDWEDFDLLKVAGRQVASYLAEARAQDALAEAQRFDEFNRRFAFILHDIKNLVSQLTLTARNAERHADNPEFRADMIATLQSSAERMNGLLARLSQHHRSRPEAPHAIEVVTLVERVAAHRKGQHPVVTAGVHNAIAHADPASLEQLLAHLLQNAIDASPANEPVTLSVSADGERVAIDVVDQGCGMSPAFIRDKLFKPFVSSKEGGFGIGAFEARQLAHAMEGRIEVTSREGRGTRFRVILKAAHPADLGTRGHNWGRAA